MKKISTTDAEKIFSQLIESASSEDEQIVLQEHGKDIAAIVSVKDFNKIAC